MISHQYKILEYKMLRIMIHTVILNNHSEFFGSFEPPSQTKNKIKYIFR